MILFLCLDHLLFWALGERDHQPLGETKVGLSESVTKDSGGTLHVWDPGLSCPHTLLGCILHLEVPRVASITSRPGEVGSLCLGRKPVWNGALAKVSSCLAGSCQSVAWVASVALCTPRLLLWLPLVRC